ncbi:uncharacterized protein LY89DRAFT_197528 [Mollisia scopiformis]|uniref:Apple domain-containing protein n=1 Tax=Mollisia scopiformis TaxID=149040 RepID=A0A194WYB5_MOLSC|nr:uncharacterized protein LY89DRAFT_197528 [Mollisia scopiformis]KUJ12958.1 hypothetical protein LY89DRAFT_197528 [Mollisia scopiformis]
MLTKVLSIFLLLLVAMPFSSQTPLNPDHIASIGHLLIPRISPKTTLYIPSATRTTSTQTSSTFTSSLSTSTTTPTIPFTTEISKSGRTIYVKTGISGCNQEGTAATSIRVLGQGGPATDILSCQAGCRFTTACEAYSFATASSNCTMYNAGLGGNVQSLEGTGVFFSMKYPADGSDFCYDDVPFTAGGSWLYPYPTRRAKGL